MESSINILIFKFAKKIQAVIPKYLLVPSTRLTSCIKIRLTKKYYDPEDTDFLFEIRFDIGTLGKRYINYTQESPTDETGM
jgi:hypothetical protein